MADSSWAISQLSKLVGLDSESAKQLIEYTNGLPRDAAAEHLKNLLGDSAPALEFISTFNSRRAKSRDASPSNGPPKSQRGKKPAKKNFNQLPPPRVPDNLGSAQGAYKKKDTAEDYMPSSSRLGLSGASSRNISPAAPVARLSAPSSGISTPKLPPSAAGSLISDLPNVRSRQASPNPKAKTKVTVAGGTPMHGASSTLNDLDSAIRSLEMQTNPSTADANPAARACDCLGTRHPVLAAAPNCLACGKVICAKEGLGPCTFCSTPLLTQAQIQDMIRELKAERGHERQSVHNAGHKKAEVSMTPRAFQSRSSSPANASLAAAQAHRDKLLNFQSQNAQRTTVHDEAADFETPSSGTNMWSSPVERAQQLKRQQKILREMEWAAKPEYEKRKVVMSVDLVGGKVVKRYGTAKTERPKEAEEDDVPVVSESVEVKGSKGAFGRNPLVGGLIKPVWKPSSDAADSSGGVEAGTSANRTRSRWRRVQDDQEDNEELILDGGVYGGQHVNMPLGAEEHSYG